MCVCSESANCKTCEAAKKRSLLFVNEYFVGKRNEEKWYFMERY
jgi:hypothetical protein